MRNNNKQTLVTCSNQWWKAPFEHRHFEKQGGKQKQMLQGETTAANQRVDYMHAQWEKDCESYNY